MSAAGSKLEARDRPSNRVSLRGERISDGGGTGPERSQTFWSDFRGNTGLPLAIILVCLFFTLLEPKFFSIENAQNIARQSAPMILLAVALGIVVISGGLDLSIGSTMGLASITAAWTSAAVGTFTGYAVGILVGLAVGVINGVIIAGAGVNPFIATIGMLAALRGLTYVLSEARAVLEVSENFDFFANVDLFGMPLAIFVVLIIVVFLWAVLRYSRFGIHVFALGGNEVATWKSGVNIRWLKYRLYMLSGACAGLAGVILSARVNSGQPTLGEGTELDVVAAILIAGVAITGGVGSLPKIALAALFISILGNGFNLIGLQSYWQQLATGVIIVFATLGTVYKARELPLHKFLASLFVDVSSTDSKGKKAQN